MKQFKTNRFQVKPTTLMVFENNQSGKKINAFQDTTDTGTMVPPPTTLIFFTREKQVRS